MPRLKARILAGEAPDCVESHHIITQIWVNGGTLLNETWKLKQQKHGKKTCNSRNTGKLKHQGRAKWYEQQNWKFIEQKVDSLAFVVSRIYAIRQNTYKCKRELLEVRHVSFTRISMVLQQGRSIKRQQLQVVTSNQLQFGDPKYVEVMSGFYRANFLPHNLRRVIIIIQCFKVLCNS